jgi:probable phosphoglycerate mutase
MAMVEGTFDDNGVDPVAFQEGVVRAMEHIIGGNPGGSVAVVCHGGVINAYLAHILGIERPLWFEPKYTSIHRVLASRRGDRSLQALNETAHLRGTNLLV